MAHQGLKELREAAANPSTGPANPSTGPANPANGAAVEEHDGQHREIRGIGRNFRRSLQDIREQQQAGELDREASIDQIRAAFDQMIDELRGMFGEESNAPETNGAAPEAVRIHPIAFAGDIEIEGGPGAFADPAGPAENGATIIENGGVPSPVADNGPSMPGERLHMRLQEMIRSLTDRFESLLLDFASSLLSQIGQDGPKANPAADPSTGPTNPVSVPAQPGPGDSQPKR